MFVELLQYNPSVDLHVAVTLRLEFPGAGQAIAAVTISPFPLLRLSTGVTLQLLMMVSVGSPCTLCPLHAWGALGTLTQVALPEAILSPHLSPCLGVVLAEPSAPECCHPVTGALRSFRRDWGAG